jgi:hypothetical protein
MGPRTITLEQLKLILGNYADRSLTQNIRNAILEDAEAVAKLSSEVNAAIANLRTKVAATSGEPTTTPGHVPFGG